MHLLLHAPALIRFMNTYYTHLQQINNCRPALHKKHTYTHSHVLCYNRDTEYLSLQIFEKCFIENRTTTKKKTTTGGDLLMFQCRNFLDKIGCA